MRVGSKNLICLVWFFYPALAMAQEKTVYTMEDLKIVAEQNNSKEFFQHYKDIRPSQRTEQWEKLLIQMGRNKVQNLKETPELTPEEFQLLLEVAQNPALKTDEVFQVDFQQVGSAYLDSCFLPAPTVVASSEDIAYCHQRLKKFWAASTQDFKTGYQIAKTLYHAEKILTEQESSQDKRLALRAGHSKQLSLLSYWLTPALKSSVSNVYCQEEWVQDYLWKQAHQIAKELELEENPELDLSFGKLASLDCWQIFQKLLLNELDSEDSQKKKTSYALLLKDQSLDVQDKDYIHILYLLGRPSSSDLFNFAWNTLKEISFDEKRRIRLMDRLAKLDPLPDQVLSSDDELKQRVLMSEFEKRFPEWPQHYRKTCLKYLQGEGDFPQGNPTIHCKKYYQLMKQAPKEIIPLSLLKPFEEYFTKPAADHP